MRSLAEKLILRDESERLTYGQDVRKAYPLADLFLKTTSPVELQKSSLSICSDYFWRHMEDTKQRRTGNDACICREP